MPGRSYTRVLLGGWLLMSPPIGKSGNIYSDAPIRDWEQVSAYDTAGECETGKQEVWGKAGNFQKRLAESGRKAMSAVDECARRCGTRTRRRHGHGVADLA